MAAQHGVYLRRAPDSDVRRANPGFVNDDPRLPRSRRQTQQCPNVDAKPSDFVKATERVYHTKAEASGIVVGVLPTPGMAEEGR